MSNEQNLNKDPETARQRGRLGGRPKGSISWANLLNKVLDQKLSVVEAGKKKKMKRRDIMMLELASIATSKTCKASDRIKAIEVILDRTEGKALQKIEQKNTEVEETRSELEERLKKIAEYHGLTLEQFKEKEGII